MVERMRISKCREVAKCKRRWCGQSRENPEGDEGEKMSLDYQDVGTREWRAQDRAHCCGPWSDSSLSPVPCVGPGTVWGSVKFAE